MSKWRGLFVAEGIGEDFGLAKQRKAHGKGALCPIK